MEGTIPTDSGAEIHDGIQSIHDVGVCDESMWKYDISKFTVRPPQECFDEATKHTAISYRAVGKSLEELKSALIAGFPVAFGFIVYSSFESQEVARTGIMPMPQAGEYILGGHAVAMVGFDDVRKVFIVRNSWGAGWGDRGYFYMPYAFITDRDDASDFWTVSKVSDDVDDGTLQIVTCDEPRDVVRARIASHVQKQLRIREHIQSTSVTEVPRGLEEPRVPQVFTEEVMNAPEPIPTQIGFPTDVPSGTVKRRNRRAKHKIQ